MPKMYFTLESRNYQHTANIIGQGNTLVEITCDIVIIHSWTLDKALNDLIDEGWTIIRVEIR
jgi:hypothetical protein